MTLTADDREAIAFAVAKAVVAILRESPAAERAIVPSATYTTNEAARLAKMHPDTLREKLRDGVIKGRRKHGGEWRVLGAELLKLA